jgi:hypothetical protein
VNLFRTRARRRAVALLVVFAVAMSLAGVLTGVIYNKVDTFWSSRGPWQVGVLGVTLLLAWYLCSVILTPPRRRRY